MPGDKEDVVLFNKKVSCRIISILLSDTSDTGFVSKDYIAATAASS